jgi:hypothetical protein
VEGDELDSYLLYGGDEKGCITSWDLKPAIAVLVDLDKLRPQPGLVLSLKS